MAKTVFNANTQIRSSEVNANFDGAYDGTLDVANNSLVTYRDESDLDFVASGCIITGDNYGNNKNASTSSGVVYIDGYRILMSAVTARTYTASKDTYVDILRSGTTASYVYTEVTNNAASPALAANSIRIGIVVTDGTSIAAATRVNQGQPSKAYPTNCNVGKAGIDSLGNKIRRTDPRAPLIFTTNVTLAGQGDILSITLPLLVDSTLLINGCASFYWGGTPAVPTYFNLYVDGSNVNANRIDAYVNTGSYAIPNVWQQEVLAGSRIVKINITVGGGSAQLSTGTLVIEARPL